MKRQPNLLFLLIDCLRGDTLYQNPGGSYIPNLDALRGNGVSFLTSISSSVTTTPCIASIFTGNYSMVHGIKTHVGYRLNPTCTTLAEILRAEGYHTYAEVTGLLDISNGLDRGFYSYRYREVDETFIGTWGEYLINSVREGSLKRPWFLFLHLWELHYPRRVLKDFQDKRYGRSPYERALSSVDWRLGQLVEAVGDDTLVVIHGDHGEDFGQSRVDEIRRILKRNLLYLLKRYLFRSSSSMRHKINKHYDIGHGYSLRESLVRVPLTISGKWLFDGPKEIEGLARQVDCMPTLLHLLGISFQDTTEGCDLLDTNSKGEDGPREAFMEACGIALPKREDWLEGVRTYSYKYICSPYSQSAMEELYDMQRDPLEKDNLATREKDMTQQMREILEKIKAGRKDVTPVSQEMNEDEKRKILKRLKDLGYF